MTADELKAAIRRLLAMEDGTCSQRQWIIAEITKLAESDA